MHYLRKVNFFKCYFVAFHREHLFIIMCLSLTTWVDMYASVEICWKIYEIKISVLDNHIIITVINSHNLNIQIYISRDSHSYLQALDLNKLYVYFV